MIETHKMLLCLAATVALLRTTASYGRYGLDKDIGNAQYFYSGTWKQCLSEVRHGNEMGPKVLTATPDPEVKNLYLLDCELTALQPGDFDNVPNVEIIQLVNNHIEHIAAGVFNTPNLKNLTFINNGILGENISPKAFANCSLKYLDLGGNNMTGASDDLLEDTAQLEELFLGWGSLEEIPTFITRASLSHLVQLSLEFNSIKTLDNAHTLAKAPNLRIIDLGHNVIEYISEEYFTPLNALTDVFLNHNQIKFLPEKLFQHKSSLSRIILANNLLEYIPLNTFEGTNLKKVDLSNNKLNFLPDNILSVSGTKLEEFNFAANLWRCPDLNNIITLVNNKSIKHDDYLHNKLMCVKLVKYSDVYKSEPETFKPFIEYLDFTERSN